MTGWSETYAWSETVCIACDDNRDVVHTIDNVVFKQELPPFLAIRFSDCSGTNLLISEVSGKTIAECQAICIADYPNCETFAHGRNTFGGAKTNKCRTYKTSCGIKSYDADFDFYSRYHKENPSLEKSKCTHKKEKSKFENRAIIAACKAISVEATCEANSDC